MSEKPLECGPLDASPISTSPSTIPRPSITRVFSTTPTANPARSYSPATNARGCSAVSPPISAQPACSQPAAMPLITVAGDSDVELLADVVVEEEQRLGTLDQDVVDAHRDQIDADRVVPAEREGELELGAHAIGAGDQDRFAVTLRQLDERAEAADAGEHFGAQRALRVRLDRLDQRVARIDVDAGLAVGERPPGGVAGHWIESRLRAG